VLFDINTKAQLAKLLAVAPGEIDHVLRKLDRYYRPQTMNKRDGSVRRLLVPQGKLKLLQKKIKIHILDKFPFLECVHGGVRGRSVLSNAFPHVLKPIVFSVDLKDFFPHVTPERVCQIFRGLGFGEECARILMKATTWNHQLPQGAPTSTALANLSLVKVDWRLRRLAQIQHFSYTRYVDDLTISGEWRLVKFRRLVQRIVESEGFHVKPQKTVTMHLGVRQVVTQLVVNTKVNMPREWRSEVRQQVFGPSLVKDTDSSMASLVGRVNWLRYVNPAIGTRLLERVQVAKGQAVSA
jgi:retron-type reverse transcriptase